MADFLSINNIPWAKTFIKSCVGYSKNFKDKRQRKNFISLLLSQAINGSALLTEVDTISSVHKNWSRALSHFFNKSKWNHHYFEEKRTQIVLNNLLKDISVVALDTTALSKSGKYFENQGKVYDSRIDGLCDGFPLLLATGITSENHYSPISHLRYCSKQVNQTSENLIKKEFTLEVIKWFENKLEMPIFTGDSGFCRKCLVELFLEEQVPFLLRTVKRKAILKAGKETLTTQLRSGKYEDVQIATQGWEHIKCNVVVAPYDEDKKERRVFLTNLSFDDYSKTEILKLYNQRWFIEESIKELKQEFDLENFRVRGWQASERFLALLFFTVSLMHLSLKKHDAWIQRVLPSLLSGLAEEFGSSVYYCRKMLKKVLFCGLVSFLSSDCLSKQCRSP